MEPTSPQNMRSASILVADDDADMRGWLRDALETDGYDVVEAANGKMAVELLRRERVDLVITDLAMPEQEGIETIRLLKEEYPKLKIIAISGAFGGTFLEIAKLLGAGAALLKPIQLDNLLHTVHQLLRE